MHYHRISSGNGLTALMNVMNGQLVSLCNGGEFMHSGGRYADDPARHAEGWANSEIIMFPVVEASRAYRVMYRKTVYCLDQHGIVRAMKPIMRSPLESVNEISAIYNYSRHEPIDNPKYSDNNRRPRTMSLPVAFNLRKRHVLNEGLLTEFHLENTSDYPFRYALGWHPAFNSLGNPEDGFFLDMDGKKILGLEELVSYGNNAYVLSDTNVRYINNSTGRGLELTSDMGKLMLWSPLSSMFCIEPITDRRQKGTLIDLSPTHSPTGSYRDTLLPKEKKKYSVEIKLIQR